MVKKQYFCLLALCAFIGVTMTSAQETVKQQRSCEEIADRVAKKVHAKVLARCQRHRAAKAAGTYVPREKRRRRWSRRYHDGRPKQSIAVERYSAETIHPAAL